MRKVYKYDIPMEDEFTLDLPTGSQILTAQSQFNQPKLWVLVDPDKPKKPAKFRLAGTGHPIDDRVGQYICSFQLHGGALVFHLFWLSK